MATYFAADHVVWAYQIGVISDKKIGERSQKVSLWSWALGSVLTMIIEANAILSVSTQRGVIAGWACGVQQWQKGMDCQPPDDFCMRRTLRWRWALQCSSRRLACL
jgi:hypothetical protein